MQGTIEKVNNNGICIEGKWFNATKECEAYVKPELKGSEVEIKLLDGSNKFTFIKVLKQAETPMPSNNSETDMKFRAMAISYAKDLVVSDDITPAELIDIADGMFHYIKTGDRKV